MREFLFLIFCSCFLITSCQAEQPNYEYLVQHPYKLRQAVQKCQAITNFSPQDEEYCKTVEHAVEAFNNLILAQQTNPELFGQRIMDEEIACAKVKSSTDANRAQDESCNNVKSMLAVAGLNSPE